MYKLPYYYKGIDEIDLLMNIIDDNNKKLDDIVNYYINELFLYTSQAEGLDIMGLTMNEVANREKLLLKMQGAKTITKTNLSYMVKELLKQDTPVEVTEFNSQYIIYIGIFDINKNIDEVNEYLNKHLRYIIPAHLDFRIYYNNLIFIKFDNYDKTWKEWDNLDLTWARLEKYNEDRLI